MKIGIEAARLTEKHRTGTENYLYYLVQELVKHDGGKDSKNEYVLYFKETPDPALVEELFAGTPNFSYKVLKPILSWTQISLALETFRNTPDVLFCSFHTVPGINPFWKMKTVAVFHDTTGKFIPSWWTAHFAHKIIAVSKFTKRELIRRFKASAGRIEVIYEGFDPKLSPADPAEITRVKEKYDIEGEYLFFLGSIGPRKNIENMVSAYLEIETEVDFVLAGKVMPGNEHLLDLPGKFIGRVPDKDLAGLFSGACFFAFVSKEEGFGIPILDAFACGTPVLTSEGSATAEVGGEAVILVDPNNTDSIQEGMERLLFDANICSSLRSKGFERLKDFSWEKTAAQVLEVFKSV